MQIIIYTFGFPVVAMGEPHPCREPHPRKSRYIVFFLDRILAVCDSARVLEVIVNYIKVIPKLYGLMNSIAL